MNVIVKSLTELDKLAKKVARISSPGTKLLFEGEVGTGKTTFITRYAKHINVKEPVTSPTFTLINQYHGNYPVFHLDLYRLNGSDELYSLDIDQFLDTRDAVVLIEWADRLEDVLPSEYIKLELTYVSVTERMIQFSAKGSQAQKQLNDLAQLVSSR